MLRYHKEGHVLYDLEQLISFMSPESASVRPFLVSRWQMAWWQGLDLVASSRVVRAGWGGTGESLPSLSSVSPPLWSSACIPPLEQSLLVPWPPDCSCAAMPPALFLSVHLV